MITNPTEASTVQADAIRVARETLTHTSTANVGEMTRLDLCKLIGRLTGSLLGLVEYTELSHAIAAHQRSERETRALLDATATQVTR